MKIAIIQTNLVDQTGGERQSCMSAVQNVDFCFKYQCCVIALVCHSGLDPESIQIVFGS